MLAHGNRGGAMAIATSRDGVRLHVEEVGGGEPIVFAHEFGGDHRSWEGEVAFFRDRYRCITYTARGYPPSDVPADPEQYSQVHARDDAIAVMDSLGIPSAHLVGLSMGAFACLHVALHAPARTKSIVLAGCGWGGTPGDEERFRAECRAAGDAFESDVTAAAAMHAQGPSRLQFQRKDPAGWQEFTRRLSAHSPVGSAHTLRGVQARRPPVTALAQQLRALAVPCLVIAGDEDERSLEPSLFLKRSMPRAALEVFPNSGHTLNLEEPERFHRAVASFLAQVESGAWPARDPRSAASRFLAPT
jgi:pimeloyl-ACP methyl ester carboxylesterase